MGTPHFVRRGKRGQDTFSSKEKVSCPLFPVTFKKPIKQ